MSVKPAEAVELTLNEVPLPVTDMPAPPDTHAAVAAFDVVTVTVIVAGRTLDSLILLGVAVNTDDHINTHDVPLDL